MQINTLKIILIIGVQLMARVAAGQQISSAAKFSWTINKNNASSPLTLVIGTRKVELLDKLGPVFEKDNNISGPGDYQIILKKQFADNGYEVFNCTAVKADFVAEYTLKLKICEDKSVELLVTGTDNVTSFKSGNITGSKEIFKQFYTGERSMEAHQPKGNAHTVIYDPSSKLYIYGFWDADQTNAAQSKSRNNPANTFLTANPAVSVDSYYGVLTNSKRLPLKERFVFRVSANVWNTYGPISSEVSTYANELSKMVFFDGWFGKFEQGIKALEFIKAAVPASIRFYIIIQHWASWKSWDSTNPDAFRIPDHTQPSPGYGPPAELKKYLDIARSMGRAGLRYNYMQVSKDSWSFKEGSIKKALLSSGEPAWFTNTDNIAQLVLKQTGDVDKYYSTDAVFCDQWGSIGDGYPALNFDATASGAGSLSETRKKVRELCLIAKGTKGPLGSESLISEFLIGKYLDAGDFSIFGANQRNDFSPEYKLRRLHQLTTFHGMGLGYRHYYADQWNINKEKGSNKYFNSDEELDSYRTCEVLYGNGAYLFAQAPIRRTHLLTECMTVGLAQRYYTLQDLDFIKYSKGEGWKEFADVIDVAGSLQDLQSWYRKVHIRYKNGCHIWINRDDVAMEVRTPDGKSITLDKNCWLVYTEDKKFISYTAVVNDLIVAGATARVDYCEDKNLHIKYINPRTLADFQGVSKPTVWVNGKVHYTLSDPEATLQ
jgi:hypothetical protein